MNKLVVAKNQKSSRYKTDDYITYGNYALDLKRYDDYKEAKSSSDKNQRERYARRIKRQSKLIVLVCVVFAMGTLIVGRYALIMKLNNQSRVLMQTVEESQKENKALNVELLKNSDIKDIENVATNDLHMVHPDNTNTIHILVAAADKNSKQEDKTQKIGVLDRVMKFFD